MTIMEKHSSAVSYITGGGLFSFGALSLNDVAMLVGILTGVGTFVVNWYYKAQDDKRRDRRAGDKHDPS